MVAGATRMHHVDLILDVSLSYQSTSVSLVGVFGDGSRQAEANIPHWVEIFAPSEHYLCYSAIPSSKLYISQVESDH